MSGFHLFYLLQNIMCGRFSSLRHCIKCMQHLVFYSHCADEMDKTPTGQHTKAQQTKTNAHRNKKC